MTKLPKKQGPDKLQSVSCVPEYIWDMQLQREVSQGSDIPENLPQHKGTTGGEMGCLGYGLAE